MFILYLFLVIHSLLLNITPDLICRVNDNISSNSSLNSQDPVKWWPSGTAKSWWIIGTAIGGYRLIPGNSRIKAITAIVTIGVTIPSVIFNYAVENPNGFNRLMYSCLHSKNTGSWPGNIPQTVSDN